MYKTLISASIILILACYSISYSQQTGSCQQFLQLSPTPEINSSELNPNASQQSSSPVPEAAPANNNYINAIQLTVNAACINGTNKQANTQAGEVFGCQGTPSKSVWYKFVATTAVMFVEVELTSSSGCFLSSAVWNASGGINPPTGSPVSCEDAFGGPGLNIHHLTGLSVGTTYYIQVSYTAGFFCGNNSNSSTGADFCIQAGTPVDCSVCPSPCGPVCQFPSMPTITQVLNNCTKYDLKSRMNLFDQHTSCFTFTAINSSLNLQMLVIGNGCVLGNVQSFNWSIQSAACGATVTSGNLGNLNATGLTAGASYVLCLNWMASCQHNSIYPFIVSNGSLPVELVNFSAQQDKNSVKLKWTTATEKDNDFFAVERSTNGITFQTLEKVKGAGDHNGTLAYEYVDNNPIEGNAIYRLKQQDFNGAFTFSKKIAVSFVKQEDKLTVIPNPVKGDMHIKYFASMDEPIQLQISNMQGIKILSKAITNSLEGLNLYSFHPDLKPGMYTLTFVMKYKTITTRFSKE